MTRVSVALAAYNGERYFREQLDSFLAQTRRPDELIVSDNASTDSTLEIIREFAARAPFDVRLVTNERNLGVTKNFERAIREATGDVIFLSDCDDVWYPEKLARMTSALEGCPSAGIVICNADMVDERLSPIEMRTWDSFPIPSKMRAQLAAGEAFTYHLPHFGNAMAFRAGLKRKFLPFPDNDYYWRQGHDGFIAWVLGCSGSCGILLLDEALLAYRQHAGQMTRPSNFK